MTNGYHPFSSDESRKKFLAHLESLEKFWPGPFEGKMVSTKYGDTFVRINGPESGAPLVLLPGGQSNSLVWRRLIGALSKRFRTYALDAIYDQGRSVPTQPVVTVDDLLRWLDQVIDGLGLEQDITLAGQSYGCYATAEYALHAPQRLRKLVWIAPVMIGATISNAFVDRLQPVAEGGRESLEAFCRWIMPSIAAHYPDEFKHRVDEILLVRECYGRTFAPIRAAVMPDYDLRRLTIPTLYILGEKDGATDKPQQAIERVAALMPRVETMLVPNAGHDIVASEAEFLIERLLGSL